MFTQNICKFVPLEKSSDNIRTINFVLETKKQDKCKMHLDAYFKICFVLSGNGSLYKNNKAYELKTNTLFFTFPSENYSIESDEHFSYMYISYIGIRASRLNDALKINSTNTTFYNLDEIRSTLIYFFQIADDTNLSTIAESALLYIYSVLQKNWLEITNTVSNDDPILKIKKYISDNFTDPNISLETISQDLSYNKNYISTMFKKKTGVSVIRYINSIRVQNACTLMKKDITCIKDISNMCGIKDQLYFSKIFKKEIGLSPTEFIKAQFRGGIS